MNAETDDPVDEDGGAEAGGDADTLIDILTGQAVPASPKNALVQKVLRQLVGSYGFDRADIRAGYRLTTRGKRNKTVDIAILRHGREAVDEQVERVIVCQRQKAREKLRSPQEAAADLRKLHERLEWFPNCRLGMWTNGHEVFFVRVDETTFETRFIDIGAWPAPGEQTDAVLREGGVTQVAADPEDLEAALGRCHQYLTRNLLLGQDAFKPLGALLLSKLYDETRPDGDRRFWIRGNEPFDAGGQAEIQRRVAECFAHACRWQPDVLRHDWNLKHLETPAATARLVTELARYSLADSLPRTRTFAFRSGVRSTMDGKGGPLPHALECCRNGRGDARSRPDRSRDGRVVRNGRVPGHGRHSCLREAPRGRRDDTACRDAGRTPGRPDADRALGRRSRLRLRHGAVARRGRPPQPVAHGRTPGQRLPHRRPHLPGRGAG